MENVVVVGSSLAGLRAVETLRQQQYTGRITVISNEIHIPYDRPPLSKKVLAGEWEPDRIALRRPEVIEALDIDWRRGVAATALDTVRREVRLADGGAVGYDGLIIATGAAVRRLPNQPDWSGVHTLRTLDDSLALRSELVTGARVVVIGAGFIGLEVAATARARGCVVTVLEGASAPMMRGLGAEMGHAAAQVHVDNGVDLRFGVKVTGLVEGLPGRVAGVSLDGGEVVAADVVVVGIGVAPCTEWLAGSGLEVRDGIVCDATLNTGVEEVFAAGDVCRWFNGTFDREMRVEHWTTASEQGAAAARNLIAWSRGEALTPFAEVPFFWSDQFNARIQFVGRVEGDEEVQIVIGSPDERAFVALYGLNGRLVGALGVSKPKQLMQFRRLIAERASVADGIDFAASLVAN